MSKERGALLPIIALMLTLAALRALATPESGLATGSQALPAAAETPTSACVIGLNKSVDPASVLLGETSFASLIVTGTCGAHLPPVDLIIVADESLSMTRGRGGSGVENPTPTRDPMSTPDPGSRPTSEIGDPSRGEPAFCSQDGSSNPPTATPTRRRRPPTEGPPEPTSPAEGAGDDELIRDVQSLIRDFLDLPEIQKDMTNDRLRIGFVAFSEKARVKQGLTNSASKIQTALSRMKGSDLTYISTGVKEAERMLVGSGSRKELDESERVQVIMILSDFQFCLRDIRSGGKAGPEIEVMTVGFGRNLNRKNQIDLASERKYVFESRDLMNIAEAFEESLAPPRPIGLAQLAIHEELAPWMRLVPDSALPPALEITGQRLTWVFDAPTLPLTLTFEVEPLESGDLPVSTSAMAVFTDTFGLRGEGPFPDARILVEAWTATPTPSPTSTSTPTDLPTSTATSTPTPGSAYLPFTLRNWPEPLPTATATPCVPEEQTIDTALVIDTSISMADPTTPGGQAKLDAAIEAAIEIVKLLKPSDQATIIGFNAEAFVLAELGGDKVALEAALRALPSTQAAGTSIDSGLQAARSELTGARHLAGNARSIILVTDGAQSGGDTATVRDAAAAAKAAGIQIVTVGLGEGADASLLSEVASRPELFYAAPSTEDLLRIYREVARLIPCP